MADPSKSGPNLGAIVAVAVPSLLSAVYFYFQLQVWKEEGHDHMLMAANFVVTIFLWASLAWALYRNFKDANRAKSLHSQIETIKDDFKLEINSLEKRHAEELRAVRAASISAPAAKHLTIHSARYGVEGDDYDVLDRIKPHSNDYLAVKVGADLIGGYDPVEGKIKRLRVKYSFANSFMTLEECVEREQGHLLVIPEGLHLKSLQEKTIVLARELNEMLNEVGFYPLPKSGGGIIVNGDFGYTEEEKQAIKAHQIKLGHRFRAFDESLTRLQRSFGELGKGTNALDQFRGNTTSDGIKTLIESLYELSMQVDEGYPRKPL